MVSIIIATKNRADLLKETLTSIQNQTYTDFECIVIDDACDKETKLVVASFHDVDSRFRYLERALEYKPGLPGSRNYGLTQSKGSFIHFVDDDDILHSRHFELKLELLNNVPDAYYVVSDIINFNTGNSIPEIDISTESEILIDKFTDYVTGSFKMISCSVLWKKEIWNKARFNENLSFSEEWDIYWQILKSNPKGVYLKCPLYFRRLHANSNSFKFLSKNVLQTNDYLYTRNNAFNYLLKNGQVEPELLKYFWNFSKKWKQTKMRDQILLILPKWKRLLMVFSWYL